MTPLVRLSIAAVIVAVIVLLFVNYGDEGQ